MLSGPPTVVAGSATRRLVRGADRIVRLLLGLERKGAGIVDHRLTRINGESAFVTFLGDRLLFTTSVATDGFRVLRFYRILKPEKLGGVMPDGGAPHPIPGGAPSDYGVGPRG